ncbi:hypothetical protein FRC01_001340 [Tulasnella sp. 417]|nr:hypothetical protein FRC01_001340 [Tulasnella sp. 417]
MEQQPRVAQNTREAPLVAQNDRLSPTPLFAASAFQRLKATRNASFSAPNQGLNIGAPSLNDKDVTLGGPKGTDIYPGVSNPTSSSNTSNPLTQNFVQDPTSDEAGAGAGPGFRGGRDAKAALKSGAGVVEARPGIIESSRIAPLQEDAVTSLE